MLIESGTGWDMLRERESARIQDGLERTVHLDIGLLLRQIFLLDVYDNALVKPSWYGNLSKLRPSDYYNH
jgi:hypothetical protein